MGCQVGTGRMFRFIAAILLLGVNVTAQAAGSLADTDGVNACLQSGWKPLKLKSAGLERSVLWKRPRSKWKQGAIVVLHGGGGSHYQFCSGGKLVEPQIEFAEQAVEDGFAVFLLDSTSNVVTDEAGRQCGKRFDFSVLQRPNVDLPFIGKMIKQIIPQLRPGRSSKKIFMTGLSTGGYMTIRAATHFNRYITAFAPVSAGDPYGTQTHCDERLSKRKSAKGVLLDLETGKKITEKNACSSRGYPNEKTWPVTQSKKSKPVFKQFHHRGDAIVDVSCMKKAQTLLKQYGYRNDGEFLLKGQKRRALSHLWLKRYNEALLDFFKSQ